MNRLVFLTNSPRWFLHHRLPVASAARSIFDSVCVLGPRDGSEDAVRAQGFEFRELCRWPAPGRSTPFGEINAVAEIHSAVKRLKPALLHNVTVRPVLYGGLTARIN